MNSTDKIIRSVSLQLLAAAWLRSIVAALTLFLMLFWFSIPAAFFCGLFVFLIFGYINRVFSSKRKESLQIIHEEVEVSEYSLSLLERDKLNIAEQLQLERLETRMEGRSSPIVLFRGHIFYTIALSVALIFCSFFPYLNFKSSVTSSLFTSDEKIRKPGQDRDLPPVFKKAILNIQPPAYTGLSLHESRELNVSAIAGSILKWNVTFSNTEQLRLTLNNSRGEELPFKKAGTTFEYSDQLLSSGLYGIRAYWKDSLIYQSDFYTMEAIPDQAPKIEPASKELYSFHFLNDPKTLQLSAKVSDDFKVKQVYLVATLARGSGENVKFREVKFPVSKSDFKSAVVSKSIDLKSLRFTPGDELYYYWAATDNKTPEPNFSKSDTYFLVYKDTAAMNESELATMAVNVLPEYFRSQRQIIIDTEKLIAKRKKISQKEFEFTSNEIGFDQKNLRIRYGQYLGEEYESSAGGGGHSHEEGEKTFGEMLKGFMHLHDQEGHDHDHGHAHSHGNEAGKASSEEEKDPLVKLMEEYVHSHDDAESNTFYELSTRSLLKASLEQMWQSELHLRLYEPEKALPFEHKALELLKEAQHKARTFIAKTSYDPPPLKEKENRMKGELKKFNSSYTSDRLLNGLQLQQLAAEVTGFLEVKRKLQSNEKQKVMLLSNQIGISAVNAGFGNWSSLTALRKLVNDQTLTESEKAKLKSALFNLVSVQQNAVNQGNITEKRLEKAFWNNL